MWRSVALLVLLALAGTAPAKEPADDSDAVEKKIEDLNRQAEEQEAAGDFAAALVSLERAFALRTKLSGPNDWRTGDARRAVEDLERREALSPEDREQLREAKRCDDRFLELFRAGKYREALEPVEQASRIRRRVLGPEHHDLGGDLSNLALLQKLLGQPEKALTLQKRSLAIYTKSLGPDHYYTAISENNMGLLLKQMGRLGAAAATFEAALRSFEKTVGMENPDALRCLSNLAICYEALGRFEEALPIARRVVEIRERVLGPQHPGTAHALQSLAGLHMTMGRYREALPLYESALSIREKVQRPGHPAIATVLNKLASAHVKLGDFLRAKPLYERAIEIREKVLGPGHPETADVWNNLANLYQGAGDYERALSLYRRAVAIYEESLGPDHYQTTTSTRNLALHLDRMAEYEDALPLHLRVLDTCRRTVGPDHPETAKSLELLGLHHLRVGAFAKALPLLERSLSICEEVLGPDHPRTAEVLGNLGVFYRLTGEPERAVPLLERSLSIYEKAFGPVHPYAGTAMSNLAYLLWRLGETARARDLYERAVAAIEGSFGAESPRMATVLASLASLEGESGRTDEALDLQERSLEIRATTQGPRHPDTALAMNDLACHRAAAGETERAGELFGHALEILLDTIGPTHPRTAVTLANLAELHARSGRNELAYPLALQALDARRKVLDSLLLVKAEREQLRQFRVLKGALDLCLSASAGDRDVSPELHTAVLAVKGRILSRQAFLRTQRGRPELAPLFEEYEAVCRRLANLTLRTPDPGFAAARRERIETLAARQEELEADLAGKSEVFRDEREARDLTTEEIAGRLPPGAALVDLIGYHGLVPRPEGEGGPERWEHRYVAFVLRRGTGPVRVELGSAERVHDLVRDFRRQVAEGGIPAAGAELRRRLWDPIEPHLGDARTVLVSPDGPLARVPFGALPGREEDTWLIEERAFAVVPAPRFLAARGTGDVDAGPSMLLVGDVDYGKEAEEPSAGLVAAAGRSPPRRGLRGAWKPLPGTRSEILSVRDSFEIRFPEGETTSLRRTRATEDAFRAAAVRHRWIHVASHGFFAPEEVRSALRELPEDGSDHVDDRLSGYHPGLLSGIVLAGANGAASAEGEDGILTALEVASLDLSGVEMVVVSACETGLGTVAGGEGVLGLQRAFQVAGARSTVTSLWEVDDRATNLLMTIFYEKLWSEGLPRAEALRAAKLALMEDEGIRGLAVGNEEEEGRLPPHFWAGFVLSGDWR